MGKSVGVNAGITGLFNLPNVGAPFTARLFAFGQKLAVSTKPRRGRGGNQWAKARAIVSSGSLAASGKLTLVGGTPLPSAWKGQEGTLTLTAATGKTETVPVRVTGASFEFDEKTKDTWDVTFSCEITDTPTWAGFGDQQAATDPAKNDQEQWGEGSTKTRDPSGLATAATRLTDIWGNLPDADDGEDDRLAAIVAAALPPLPGLKLRTATFQRDSDDGGTVLETWGLTSTADDQILPRTTLSVDTSGIGSTATTAALNDVAPDAPAGDNFLLRDTQTATLSDGNTVTVGVYGKTTRQQDIENPGTFTRVDPSGLESAGQETRVYDSAGAAPAATVPSGLQLVGTNTQTVNPDKDQVQYFYAKDTPQQRAEQAETFGYVDPNGLESEGAVAAMDADPVLPDGYVAVGTRTKNLTHDHALNVLAYGLLDSKDKVEMPGTWYEVDPNDLETRGLDTAVFATIDGEPDDPAPAHGTKIVSRQVVELNRLSSKRVITLGLADSVDKLVLAATAKVVDPGGLQSSEATAAVGTAAPAATVAGLVLRTTRTTHPVPGVDLNAADYGARSTTDDVEMPRTFTYADPDAINSKGAAAEVYATLGGEPGDAAPPLAELKVVGARTEELDRTSSVKVTEFDTTTAAEKLTLPKTVEVVDPNGLRSAKAAAALNATPATPAGLVLRTTRTEHPTASSTLVTVEAGTRDTVDDEEMPGTWTETDPQGIRDRGLRTEVYATTDGLPLDPTPPAGQKIRSTRTQELDRTHSTRVDEFGLNDAKDDVEQAGTSTSIDPDGIEDADEKTSVTTSDTPPAATGALAPRAGLSLAGTTFKPLPGGHYAHTLHYAPLTSTERIEHRGTTAAEDPAGGTSSETTAVSTVLAADTAADLAATALAAVDADATVARVTVRKENKTRAVTTVTRVDDDKTVRSSVRTRPEKVLGTPSGGTWSATAVAATVRVARVPTIGADNTVGLIQHQTVERTRGRFALRRRFVATDADSLTALYHADLLGQVSNGVFLDRDAHTMKYSGWDLAEDTKRRDGSHAVVIDYYFDLDSLFHMNESNLAYGWVPTQTATTYITGTGYYVSTAVFATDMTISFPDEADFSVFLA